eukprot:NODE_3041_length_1062_cov_20.213228_g2792_i0.p1 GENE.NODE_3041_length_1062_cov_20.213228_g2792_i0~~NODE_3041_length_1062_cov_20.213228_g2792_i0.p1  ORF type:complete len:255 (-),score=32.46 NODE_3041_length_1062_cov_20.213228_g2792_i0:296-970(-)
MAAISDAFFCHQPYQWLCTACGANSCSWLRCSPGSRKAAAGSPHEVLPLPGSPSNSSDGLSHEWSADSRTPERVHSSVDLEDSPRDMDAPQPKPYLDREKALVDPVRYKTKLCRNFKLKGSCRFSFTCCFAHGQSDLRRASQNATLLDDLPVKSQDQSKRSTKSAEAAQVALEAILRCNAKKTRRKDRGPDSVNTSALATSEQTSSKAHDGKQSPYPTSPCVSP